MTCLCSIPSIIKKRESWDIEEAHSIERLHQSLEFRQPAVGCQTIVDGGSLPARARGPAEVVACIEMARYAHGLSNIVRQVRAWAVRSKEEEGNKSQGIPDVIAIIPHPRASTRTQTAWQERTAFRPGTPERKPKGPGCRRPGPCPTRRGRKKN